MSSLRIGSSRCTYGQRGRYDMRPSWIMKLFYVYIYSRFVPNFDHDHLIVIQSLNLWESHLLVSCIMSPINLKFLRHCDWNKLQARQTDRQTAGYSRAPYGPDTFAARQNNARCWSSLLLAMRRDSGVQCMLFYRYLNVNCTNMKTTLYAKNRCINIKPTLSVIVPGCQKLQMTA